MKLSKEEKKLDDLIEVMEDKNLDSPNKECDEIDEKFEFIYENLEYEDYLNFIKSNEYINFYDKLLGNYSNNIPQSKELIDAMPKEIYKKINETLDDKIKDIKKES